MKLTNDQKKTMVAKAVGYVFDLLESEEEKPPTIPEGFTGVTIPKYAMKALQQSVDEKPPPENIGLLQSFARVLLYYS